MPKYRFNAQTRHRRQMGFSTNCDLLVGMMKELGNDYMQVMSLDEKIMLLDIARTVLRNRQILPSSERIPYEIKVKGLLVRCKNR